MIKQHSLPTRIEKGSGICCSKTLWSQLVHHFCSIRCVFVVVELAATKGIPSTNQLSLPIVIIPLSTYLPVPVSESQRNPARASSYCTEDPPCSRFNLLLIIDALELDLKVQNNHGFDPQAMPLRAFFREKRQIASGGYSDVTVGNLYLDFLGFGGVLYSAKLKVAIKRVRVSGYIQNGCVEQYARDCKREVRIWSSCRHQHIVPFLGVIIDIMNTQWATCCLVSKFCPKGTLTQYLQDNPGVDRMKPIYEIACGLKYLHTREVPVIHRDIKGANILIDDTGSAMIGDFGCARFASAGTSGSFFAATYEEVCGSVRWLCPEILMPTLGESEEAMHIYSTASDVWAFGMTALEVVTSEIPYSCARNDGAALLKIVNGIFPERPHPPMKRFVLDCVWDLMIGCWARDPKERPDMKSLKERLQNRSVTQHLDGCSCAVM